MIIALMLAGAGIVYWLLRTFYNQIWNKNLETSVYFSTAHAVQGDTIELIEVVANGKRLPLPYINVKFQLDRSFAFEDGSDNAQISDKTYRNDIFSLLMYQRSTRKIPVTCTKRGVYRIDRIELVSTGIFMNEVLVVNCLQNEELTVYPAALDPGALDVPFSKMMGMIERNRYLYEDPFAFRGIRDYDAHDAMNTINWKASARTGGLMVNQYNETMCQEVCILLNLEPEGMLRYDQLSEASISIAAGLSQRFIEQGIQVSLVSNGRDTGSGEEIMVEPGSGFNHINAVNTALARIDLSQGQTDFAGLLQEVKEKKTEQTLYIMISQNQRETLQRHFDSLTRHSSDCMWIVPYHTGMEVLLNQTAAQTVTWEVMHYGR